MAYFVRTNLLINRLIAFGKQSLFRNAGYLMGISLANAIVGFLFWGLAAHLYLAENVGYTSAIISAAFLVCGLTDFGMSVGLFRYLPETPMPISFLNSIFSFEVLTSVLAGMAYLAGISIWSPSLLALQNNWIFILCFLVYTIFSTLGSLVSRAFIARRKSLYALLFSLISNGSRLIFVILLVSFGSIGLFGSLTVSIILASLISLLYLLPKIEPGYRLHFAINWSVLVTILPYSLGNYIVGLLSMVSQRLLPLLIIEKLGPASSGHFYIAWMISEFIASPNTALSDATFAEGSNTPEMLDTHLLQSAKIGLGVTIPAAIIVFLGSPYILRLFGASYTQEASGLLRWLAMAAPFTVISGLYFTSLRVRKKIKQLVVLSAIFTAVTLGVSFSLIGRFGITVVGIGWFIAMSVITFFAIIGFRWLRIKGASRA
jgi:O-antigen/teichoic acid export membrane protein